MLDGLVKELEDALNAIPEPTGLDIVKMKFKNKREKKKIENILVYDQVVDIDVDTDEEGETRKLGDTEDVKDRWSRYIGAMGMDAVTS